jgi:hypothetical protein
VWNAFINSGKGGYNFDADLKVKKILYLKTNINIYNHNKESLLGCMIESNGANCILKYITELIKGGADVNYRNPKGKTPIIICEERMVVHKRFKDAILNLNKIKTLLIQLGAKV